MRVADAPETRTATAARTQAQPFRRRNAGAGSQHDARDAGSGHGDRARPGRACPRPRVARSRERTNPRSPGSCRRRRRRGRACGLHPCRSGQGAASLGGATPRADARGAPPGPIPGRTCGGAPACSARATGSAGGAASGTPAGRHERTAGCPVASCTSSSTAAFRPGRSVARISSGRRLAGAAPRARPRSSRVDPSWQGQCPWERQRQRPPRRRAAWASGQIGQPAPAPAGRRCRAGF